MQTSNNTSLKHGNDACSWPTFSLLFRLYLTHPITGYRVLIAPLMLYIYNYTSIHASLRRERKSSSDCMSMREDQRRLDQVNSPRSKQIRQFLLFWVYTNSALLLGTWAIIWWWYGTEDCTVATSGRDSTGIIARAGAVLELVGMGCIQTALEYDKSSYNDVKELQKKRYAYKGA